MIPIGEGDSIKRLVTIKKIKKGVPTVIAVGGRIYTLQSPDQYGASKTKGGGKRADH